ncbi:hypothetical protein ACVCH0_03810 [Burkholderia glumae]|uniref:hypothetical protein n=1 Tax=Burkholderia glumae TaxID=337 RepID=UPI001F3CD2B0|nr:hypothetical protein [Burkholderia glumae]
MSGVRLAPAAGGRRRGAAAARAGAGVAPLKALRVPAALDARPVELGARAGAPGRGEHRPAGGPRLDQTNAVRAAPREAFVLRLACATTPANVTAPFEPYIPRRR